MRVALLTMMEPVQAGLAEASQAHHAGRAAPRAYLRVGGVSLARHQLGLALALECRRIVCFSREITPELVAMQHVAERAGAQFHVVSSTRALAGLVTAADEMIVLGEGVLALSSDVTGLLELGPGIAVLPAETAVPAGFERIDLQHAGAGAMRLPGRLAERLTDLPPDSDAFSALMRIALQSGVTRRMVPVEAREPARWSLLRDEAQAHAVEAPWIALLTGAAQSATPAEMLATLAVRRIGPALLHAGTRPGVVTAAGGAMVLIGMGLGWFGLIAPGLVCAGIGWTLRKAAALLLRVQRDSLSDAPSRWPGPLLFGWVFDLMMVALLGWGLPAAPGETSLARYFPPFMLLCLTRVIPRTMPGRWAAVLGDRLLLMCVLALASAGGVLNAAVYALAIGLALAGIELPRTKPSPPPQD